jgi:hypothetical protein
MVLVVTCTLALGACGGDGGTGGAPNVEGLSLPAAKQRLQNAGYNADVSSDGLFGVIVEENWVVCDQSEPSGHLVPLDVSKDC